MRLDGLGVLALRFAPLRSASLAHKKVFNSECEKVFDNENKNVFNSEK